jgi:hypothetical protein
MKIERATRDDVHRAVLNMRQHDFDEFVAVAPVDTREELSELLAERYGGRDDVLCGSDAGEPLCVGGAFEGRPNVLTMLFFATDAFPSIALPVARFIRGQYFPRLFAAGVHRVEAISSAENKAAHTWMRMLGMAPETGPLLGYGKRGEAFIQFSKVVDVRSPGA